MITEAMEVARRNFERMVEGEPWAGKCTLRIGPYREATLVGYADGRNEILIPAWSSADQMTVQIAHELGHIADRQINPPPKAFDWLFIRVRSIKPPWHWIASEMFYALFGEPLVGHEVRAEQQRVRLLGKIAIPIELGLRDERDTVEIRRVLARRTFFGRRYFRRLERQMAAVYEGHAC